MTNNKKLIAYAPPQMEVVKLSVANAILQASGEEGEIPGLTGMDLVFDDWVIL